MNKIKHSVISLLSYEVPQKARIKLNQNESPYDIPLEYKEEIANRLVRLPWNRYPSGEPLSLKRLLAQYTDFSEEGIVVGNGSNELILAILLAYCDKSDTVTLVTPGFAIYSYLSKIMNLRIKEVQLKEGFAFDVEELCRNAYDSRITFIASPNNPTGTVMEMGGIEEVVRIKKSMVVIDEAYFEFHGLTAQPLLDKYDNILILRTFSKAFGLAGIRLGYLLARPEIAREIAKTKLPFSVGIFQQVAGAYLLKKKGFVKMIVKKIISERERVYRELGKIPQIEPIPSKANFILFKVKGNSADSLFELLYKNSILLRRFSNPHLKDALRVTIGKPEENDTFLKNLNWILKKEM
jgi:histidinol-phosphate aminotransferase